jgi:hypothetical protein
MMVGSESGAKRRRRRASKIKPAAHPKKPIQCSQRYSTSHDWTRAAGDNVIPAAIKNTNPIASVIKIIWDAFLLMDG